MDVKGEIEALLLNHCWLRRTLIIITYSECVSVAFVSQHAKRMSHIVLSRVACPFLPYFSPLSHKGRDFSENVLNIKYLFWFSLQLLSETFFILSRTERDLIKSIYRSSCKVPVIFVGFKLNMYFVNRFSKKYWTIQFYENLSKGSRSVPWGLTWRS
jgi:hypothetical protein